MIIKNKYILNFLKYQYLLKELVKRDLKVKYKRSVLGLLWTLLNPLFNMIILTIVFSTIFKSNIPNFPVYFLCGSVFFSFFAESTSLAMNSVYTNASLIRKVYIPKYLFPVSKVLFSLVNLLFSFVAVIIVMIATKSDFHSTIMLFFMPVIYLFFFSIGIGLIISCMAVFFRDLAHLYGIIITALNFLTPIFYPIEILPKKIIPILELNPLYQVILMFRQIVLMGQLPSISQHLYLILWAAATLIVGLIVFYKNQDKYVLYL